MRGQSGLSDIASTQIKFRSARGVGYSDARNVCNITEVDLPWARTAVDDRLNSRMMLARQALTRDQESTRDYC